VKNCFTKCVSTTALFCLTTVCYANNPRFERLKDIYQYDKWVGSVQTNYLHSVQNWMPDFTSYGVTNLLTEPYISSSQNMRESIYFFQATNMLEKIDLRILETSSILDAQEMLMEHFSYCSAIHPFPTGKSIGVNIGDHCYTGYPIGSTNSISFVRNNMFINISSEASVYDIANKIDQQLLTISLTPE